MPESCSSNALNGCANCGPGLALFSVSASANYPAPTLCPTYLDTRITSSRSTSGRHDTFFFVAIGNGTANTSHVTTVQIKEDEESGITTTRTTVTASSNTSSFGNVTATAGKGDGSSSLSETTIVTTDLCGNTKSTTSGTANYSFTSCWNGYCTTSEGQDFMDYTESGCVVLDYGCPPGTCTINSNCEGSSLSSKVDCTTIENETSTWNRTGNAKSTTVYSNPISVDQPDSIVSKQISKLKINKFPCTNDCCLKCGGGEGKKDDCWGGFSSFTIVDPTVTISKAALKIGVIKEGFDKEYKSVGGKVKFYIPSSEDAEEGRTPCCSDDFSGTVVKEVGYSLGGSDFKEGVYLATDIGEISNTSGPVGGIVVACITIDDVSFV